MALFYFHQYCIQWFYLIGRCLFCVDFNVFYLSVMPVRHLNSFWFVIKILASLSHPRTLSHIVRTVGSSPSQSICALFCAVFSCVLPAGPSDHGPDSSQHQHASISTKFHDPGRADGLHGDGSCLPYLPYFYGCPSGWWRGEDTHMHTLVQIWMMYWWQGRKT